MKPRPLAYWKVPVAISLSAAVVALASALASAHVVVHPGTAAVGAYQIYTVSVPVEKNSDTTKLELDVPDGVKVVSVQPAPGWQTQLVKNASGSITAIVWTGDLKPEQFMQFDFQGVNPKSPTTVAWKAYQTYADGTVVAWTGAPGADTPASTTRIQATGSPTAVGSASPGAQTPAAPAAAAPAAPPSPAAQGSSAGLPVGLSLLAVVLSIVSLVVGLRRRGA